MGQNNQKYRLKYWATRSSVRSFARTAHSFACSALLALLVRLAALTHLLAHSLCLLPRSWDSEWLDGYLFCVFSVLAHSAIQDNSDGAVKGVVTEGGVKGGAEGGGRKGGWTRARWREEDGWKGEEEGEKVEGEEKLRMRELENRSGVDWKEEDEKANGKKKKRRKNKKKKRWNELHEAVFGERRRRKENRLW